MLEGTARGTTGPLPRAHLGRRAPRRREGATRPRDCEPVVATMGAEMCAAEDCSRMVGGLGEGLGWGFLEEGRMGVEEILEYLWD